MSGAVEGVALLPVAYLHTLHMEGGQTNERLSSWDGVDEYEPSRTAFGSPGRDYSEEYFVTTQPLYTRIIPPVSSYADGVQDAAKVAEDQTRLNVRACRVRADYAMANEFQGLGDVITAAIRLLSQGGKADV